MSDPAGGTVTTSTWNKRVSSSSFLRTGVISFHGWYGPALSPSRIMTRTGVLPRSANKTVPTRTARKIKITFVQTLLKRERIYRATSSEKDKLPAIELVGDG